MPWKTKILPKPLYQAFQAGVHVDLIIRDSCRLRPGIAGLSDNIKVVSIVGRFLEHARIYYFKNGGEEEYFIGSADLMTRNLESRVEVVTPVENKTLQTRLREVLDIQLNNKRSVWDMQPDGTYVQRRPGDKDDQRSVHEITISWHGEKLRISEQCFKTIWMLPSLPFILNKSPSEMIRWADRAPVTTGRPFSRVTVTAVDKMPPLSLMIPRTI